MKNLSYELMNIMPENIKKLLLHPVLSNLLLANQACHMRYKVTPFPGTPGTKEDIIKKIRSSTDFYSAYIRQRTGCGACGIYRLSKSGVKVFKLEGRLGPATMNIKDTRFIRHCLDILGEVSGEEEYYVRCIVRHREIYGYNCSARQCYYPEIWKRAWKKPLT